MVYVLLEYFSKIPFLSQFAYINKRTVVSLLLYFSVLLCGMLVLPAMLPCTQNLLLLMLTLFCNNVNA